MNNIFESIPEDLSSEIFESLVESDHIRIERIVSKGHTSPDSGWYDQDNNEWVMILKGEATLTFADESPVTLKAGDYINLPAHKKHKVTWTATDIETVWLAVHY
jgi:cupin 2 domain-containing protein